jgi:hypothetical protein
VRLRGAEPLAACTHRLSRASSQQPAGSIAHQTAWTREATLGAPHSLHPPGPQPPRLPASWRQAAAAHAWPCPYPPASPAACCSREPGVPAAAACRAACSMLSSSLVARLRVRRGAGRCIEATPPRCSIEATGGGRQGARWWRQHARCCVRTPKAVAASCQALTVARRTGVRTRRGGAACPASRSAAPRARRRPPRASAPAATRGHARNTETQAHKEAPHVTCFAPPAPCEHATPPLTHRKGGGGAPTHAHITRTHAQTPAARG